MKKKILSIFLAVVMIVGMIPFGTISVSSADISNAWFGSDANTAAGAFELNVYNGSIRVSGWVVDPKNAQNSYDAEVHIYIKRGDTKYLFYAITETPVLRDDVNRNEGVQRYCPGITGNHGFDVYIPTVCGYDGESKGQPLSGNYSIDIYAVSKAGGNNHLFGTYSCTLKAPTVFDANGGELGDVPATQCKTGNATSTLPTAVPTKAGYVFKEWNTDINGNGTAYQSGAECEYSGTLYAQWTKDHNNLTFKSWNSSNSLPNTAGNWELTKDITLTGIWTVPAGTTNLCLNGHVINLNGGNRIKLDSNATLNLYDCGTATEHYFTYRQKDYWSLVASPTNEQKAGAVSLDDITGTTTTNTVIKVSGGAITGGTGGYGNVEIVGGTFTMNGGNIIGHTHPDDNVQGGGVRVSGSGTFNMNGGLIAGCKVRAEGGGVIVYAGSTFNMNGGTIAFNTSADKAGGGVYNSGTFNMTGGTIEYCFAGGTGFGGGVYNSGTFNMSGGIIQGNIAKATDTNGKGGGVDNRGTFTMSDGIIQNNTANRWGGGVHNLDGTFTMTGGSVINNRVLDTKTYDGGGAGIYGSNVTVSNATITGNKCDENGKGKGNQIRGNSNTVIKDYCTIENDDSNDLSSVTNNITKTAITLDKLGGKGGSDTVDPAYNAAMPKITVPTLSGCMFLGYFDAATGGTKYYNADGTSAKNWDKIVANTTLYAQWNKNWTLLIGETDEDGKSIDSGYYYITEDTLCNASTAGNSGLNIAANSSVYLYIPAGVTLTCTGADASGKTGGGAGIYLPESATLHIYGEGTLKAQGGNAAAGGAGNNGDDGWAYGGLNNGGTFGSGSGGAGGVGGGGAGAGIGTPGGLGGDGGGKSSASAARSLNTSYGYNAGCGGNAGKPGSAAATMGTLHIQSSLILNVTGGGASDTQSVGGSAGTNKFDAYNSGKITWSMNGGAGGGAGGNGYPAEDIGTGGAGAGGGGGGSSPYAATNGSLSGLSGNASGDKLTPYATGGAGGKGYVDGANGETNNKKFWRLSYDWNNTSTQGWGPPSGWPLYYGGGAGAAGGESVAYTGDTSFDGVTFNITYLDENDAVYGSSTYTVGSTSTVTLPDYPGYAWRIIGLGKPCGPDSEFTSYSDELLRGTVNVRNVYGDLVFKAALAPYTVALNFNGGTGGTVSVTATFDSAMPNVTVPTKKDCIFLGYFDAATGGTKYYNADGTSAKIWDKASDTTLYAQWQKLSYENYLVKAPTVDENGLYNQRSYYINSSNEKVIVETGLLGDDCEVDFAGWYLRTFAQVKMQDGNMDVRLISMLNGECFDGEKLLDYDCAGFKITIAGVEITPTTKIANTSFLADGKEIFITDYSNNPNGKDYFFLANNVFAKEVVDADAQITATPFVKLMDGTDIVGKTVSFKLSDLK